MTHFPLRRALACAAFALAAHGAIAQTSAPVALESLTTTELQARVRAGATIVLVPIGGTEQSGPHMALGKHNVRVRALSEKIARTLGNALVAPVIAYVPEGSVSPPSGHMRFAGTISVPEDVFEKTLEYASRSLRASGFRDIVFLGDHGDYRRSEQAVAQRLNREWASSQVRVHAIVQYYDAARAPFAQALASRGYRSDEIGVHAGLADTSLMLAIDPSLVRTDRLEAASKAGSAGGVTGDPRRSSAELGQLGVDLIVSQTVGAIRKATERR